MMIMMVCDEDDVGQILLSVFVTTNHLVYDGTMVLAQALLPDVNL